MRHANLLRSRGAPAPEFFSRHGTKALPNSTDTALPNKREVRRRKARTAGAVLKRSPARADRRALALRRPTAALAGVLPPARPRPRFTPPGGRRRYLRHRRRLSEAPRAPVVMPAGSMPGPPEDGLQARPQEPPRSIDRLSPVDVPSMSGKG